ncbi:hypothetical protein Mpt1_c03270 [Candidatus Methanoplasma termitum]|uniref:Bacterial repeat domain-containing protein n=1 Tax=Candidatus Methanoplasma termitum TaxID=1577791 RepID=A0A0A7LAX4_9ARCH|nr:hypothetical protein [Candidatus Methanoplasma termitum]AIZ56224.1 hypothetical protein Mpt1_c03270 [Candidatus Methanoplasma termitum]MCL2334388.1 hypothetical protein [Candidatus Methanoplasma sp.]
MKTDKMMIAAIATFGALMFLSAFGALSQSNDNSAADATYVLTVSVTEGSGTIEYKIDNAEFTTYTAPVPITAGSTVVVKPIPASGYVFYKWVTPTNLFSPTLTFNDVNASINLNAQFKDETTAPEKTVLTFTGNNVIWKIGGDSGGAVQVGDTFSFFPGTVITVKADPFTGFKGPITITVDGASYNAGDNFTVPASNATFEATGATPIQNFTVTLHVHGYGTVEGAGTFAESSTVTIKAIADEGSVFKEWSDGNTEAVRTITVDSNIELTASFVKDSGGPGEGSNNGGSSMVIYVVIIAIVLAVICVVVWFLWFKKP